MKSAQVACVFSSAFLAASALAHKVEKSEAPAVESKPAAQSAATCPAPGKKELANPMETLSKAAGSLSFVLGKGTAAAIEDYQTILFGPKESGIRSQYSEDSHVGGANYGILAYAKSTLRSNPALSKKMATFWEKNTLYGRSESAAIDTVKTIKPVDQESYLEPGWLWHRALVAANGDSLSAMRLIGFCTHDQLGNDLVTSSNNIVCPKMGTMAFVPGSLGSNVDAPERVTKLAMQKFTPQTYPALAPKESFRKDGALRPKAYHVNGAALVACEMIAKGHDPKLVVSMAPMLAWAYRFQRFNTELCGTGTALENLGFNPTKLQRLTIDNPDFNFSNLLLSGMLNRDTNGLPYSEKWMNGVLDKYSDEWTTRVGDKPKDMSAEEYAKYKKMHQLMVIDFVWTMMQHRAGAQFAAQHCKKT